MKGIYNKILGLALFLVILPMVYFVCGSLLEEDVPEMDADLISASERMAFGVTIGSASSFFGKESEVPIDETGAKKDIDAAVLLGADLIRVDLEGRTLENEEEMKKLDSVRAYARERGLGIELAYYGRRGKAEWEGFKTAYQEDAGLLSRRYEPEYFLILPECPSVVGKEIDSERSPSEWLGFMKKAAIAVRKNSADSKIVLEEIISSDADARGETEFAGEVIRDNDPAIDIISLKTRTVDEMEKGIESLLRVTDKHHWHGAVWMSSVEYPGGSALSGADREDGQKNFLLYALHLAGTNGFGAITFAELRDRDGFENGVLREDYSPKPAYDAIAGVMGEKGR